MNRKLGILGLALVMILGVMTASGTANAQEPPIEDALSSSGFEDPEVSISGNEVIIEYREDISVLDSLEEELGRIANILTIVSNELSTTYTVGIRQRFDDGEIVEITGKPEDGQAFLDNQIAAERFLDILKFKLLTRGATIPAGCESERGDNCENCETCACYPNETCAPANPKANEKGCVVTHIPSNAHLVGSAYVCDDGYEWNLDLTDCVPEKECPPNASRFQDECYCVQGYEWDTGGEKCVPTTAQAERLYPIYVFLFGTAGVAALALLALLIILLVTGRKRVPAAPAVRRPARPVRPRGRPEEFVSRRPMGRPEGPPERLGEQKSSGPPEPLD